MTREYVEKRMRDDGRLEMVNAVQARAIVDVALALVQEATVKGAAAMFGEWDGIDDEKPRVVYNRMLDKYNQIVTDARLAAARKPEREGGGE